MGEAFIEAMNARQQPDSDAEDIDRFLALFADNVVDEHIKFNVTVTDKREASCHLLRLTRVIPRAFSMRLDWFTLLATTTVLTTVSTTPVADHSVGSNGAYPSHREGTVHETASLVFCSSGAIPSARYRCRRDASDSHGLWWRKREQPAAAGSRTATAGECRPGVFRRL
ncbi:MAG: hypothetical protein AAFS02_15345 [Pseudomonadota bacterium]